MRTVEALRPVYRLDTRYGEIWFDVPNLRTLHTPWDFHKKEPPTIEWVDRMPLDATFWDIGANVGEFSLYAAKRGVRTVVAFEPGPANYANLCRNRELNGFDDNMLILCLGLSDEMTIASFNMTSTDAGHSCHSIDDTHGAPAYVENIMTMTIDQAISELKLTPPSHIKVDIDGAEELLIEGGVETLSSGATKSLYMEFAEDEERFDRISARMGQLGFEKTGVYRPAHLNYFFAEYEFAK